jgi:hypothetical protein
MTFIPPNLKDTVIQKSKSTVKFSGIITDILVKKHSQIFSTGVTVQFKPWTAIQESLKFSLNK